MAVDNILYKEKLIYKALEELDSRLLKLGVKPFDLKVVGGFALMLENVRLNDYTDIDYIGKPLDNSIKEIVDSIGLEYGLGRGWINNDVLMSGFDLDDIELSTGKLEFKHVTDMNVIRLYSLDKECILRMKIIAIDTSYMSAESTGSFDRSKDFKDIKLLMETIGVGMDELIIKTGEYVLNPQIYYLVNYYNKFNDVSNLSSFSSIKQIIETKGQIGI